MTITTNIIPTLLFLLVLVVNLCAGSGGDCRESERMALLHFKAELIDDDSRLSSWGFSNCCEWKGVVCDNRTNHVVVLDLHVGFNSEHDQYAAAPLRGKISSSLLQLPHLQYLDLSFNNFHGTTLPSFIGSLSKLQHLNLVYCSFHGPIPHQIGNLSALRYLDLSANDFHGTTLPSFIASLSKLQHLSLHDSNFVGPIPHQIGNLSALRHLDLSYNNFYGNTNLDWLSGSPTLEYLDLSSANLEGCTTWLQVIYKLPALKELLLSDCQLPTIVPISVPSHNSSESLVGLDLSFNNLDSSVLQMFLNVSSGFTFIRFSDNNMEGRIPNALGNLTSLSYLDLSWNQLHGEFPLRSQNSSSLTHLDLSGNSLNGPVSHLLTWLQDPIKLNYIYLNHNLLSGSLPNISRFSALKKMNLRNNALNGLVLEDSVRLPNLECLDLSINELSGILPVNLRLPTLKYLDLSMNKFTGISSGNLWLPNLESLDLSTNKFAGKLPNISSCVSLKVLKLFDNTFNGSLIENIDHLPKIKLLHAAHNSLEDVITEAHLSSLPQLTDLDLSFNLNITLSISSHRKHTIQFQYLYLANCKLGPGFPEWLQNQEQLEYLDISNSGILDIWKRNEATFIKTLGLLRMIDLSSNELTGVIPQEITSLIGLLGLNLSRNNLAGLIPQHIDQFELLNFLDLSRNNLTGGIPPTLSKLSHLGVLDLSFNNLSGRIPWETHMQTFGASAYMGNPGLCGPPLLSRACPEDVKPTNGSGDSDKLINRGFYISMLLGFVLAFWVAFWILFFQKWWSVFVMKAYMGVEDWLYVHILVNKRRLMRLLGKS